MKIRIAFILLLIVKIISYTLYSNIYLGPSKKESRNQYVVSYSYYITSDNVHLAFIDNKVSGEEGGLGKKPCAENGSCYGDISEQTNNPKTI